MTNFKKIIVLVALSAFVAMAAVGCEKEGTMEKAGKKVDQAVDSAKEAAQEATDK